MPRRVCAPHSAPLGFARGIGGLLCGAHHAASSVERSADAWGTRANTLAVAAACISECMHGARSRSSRALSSCDAFYRKFVTAFGALVSPTCARALQHTRRPESTARCASAVSAPRTVVARCESAGCACTRRSPRREGYKILNTYCIIGRTFHTNILLIHNCICNGLSVEAKFLRGDIERHPGRGEAWAAASAALCARCI